MALKTF